MSLNAIYASKLYKASKRKNKIRAAANDPLNAELVLQLNEYLDDEYRKDNSKQIAEKVDKAVGEDDEKEERIRPSEHSAPSGGGSGFSAPPMSGGSDHHLSEEMAEAEGGFEAPPESESAAGDVEESTRINKSAVMSSTDIASEIDSIIGLLNSREDTAGVCRGLVKDNEVWIHYKDAINLNNVMEPVIALLNASNYSALDFNRLARTENAIVFSISETPKPMDPIQEEVDEK